MSTEYPLLDLQSIGSSFLRDNGDLDALLFAKITPVIASDILKNYIYNRQRPISRHKVIELVNYMEEGTFEPKTNTINFNIQKGNVVLTDGQHRLTALVEANKNYVFPVMVTGINPDYVYPKTDRGKPRTLLDALRSNNTAYLMGLTETATRNIAVGIKLIEEGYIVSGSHSKKISEDKLVKITVEKYKKQALHFFEMTNGLDHTRKLRSRLPTGLFLTLYTELPETEWKKVDEFIFGSGTAEGLTEGDPRRLVYALYTTYVRQGGSIKKTMTRKEEIATLLTAWEYWYKKQPYKTRFKIATLERILKYSPNVAGTTVTFRSY